MFLLSQCHTLVNCGSSESGESGCLKFHQLWIFVTEKKMSYPNLDNEKKRAGKNHTHQRGQALGIAIVIGSQHRQSLSVCAYVDPVAAENRIANCWCCFFFFFFINQIELRCSQLALNLVFKLGIECAHLRLGFQNLLLHILPKKVHSLVQSEQKESKLPLALGEAADQQQSARRQQQQQRQTPLPLSPSPVQPPPWHTATWNIRTLCIWFLLYWTGYTPRAYVLSR